MILQKNKIYLNKVLSKHYKKLKYTLFNKAKNPPAFKTTAITNTQSIHISVLTIDTISHKDFPNIVDVTFLNAFRKTKKAAIIYQGKTKASTKLTRSINKLTQRSSEEDAQKPKETKHALLFAVTAPNCQLATIDKMLGAGVHMYNYKLAFNSHLSLQYFNFLKYRPGVKLKSLDRFVASFIPPFGFLPYQPFGFYFSKHQLKGERSLPSTKCQGVKTKDQYKVFSPFGQYRPALDKHLSKAQRGGKNLLLEKPLDLYRPALDRLCKDQRVASRGSYSPENSKALPKDSKHQSIQHAFLRGDPKGFNFAINKETFEAIDKETLQNRGVQLSKTELSSVIAQLLYKIHFRKGQEFLGESFFNIKRLSNIVGAIVEINSKIYFISDTELKQCGLAGGLKHLTLRSSNCERITTLLKDLLNSKITKEKKVLLDTTFIEPNIVLFNFLNLATRTYVIYNIKRIFSKLINILSIFILSSSSAFPRKGQKKRN